MSSEAFKPPEDKNYSLHGQKFEKKSGNFFQRIQNLFKPQTQIQEVKLSGRIHELQKTADRILFDLLLFKSEAETKVEPYLFSIICTAIDPIIKEIVQIQKLREHQNSATWQVKNFQRYTDWLEKAKAWVELKDRCEETNVLYQAALNHTIKEFQARIDRDLQVILDYLNHALSNIDIQPNEGKLLRDQLIQKLDPHLLKLNQLKNPAPEITLETLIVWRSTSDTSRETCFGEALHIIDTLVSQNNSKFAVNEHDTKEDLDLEILTQLTQLEEKISELAMQMETLDSGTKLALLVKLDDLDEKAHELNVNLLLPHEYTERVQQAIETLSALREDLSF